MAGFIELHRTFSQLVDERADPEAYSFHRGDLTWDYLMARRRVVVLAEAGSGKSDEFAHRAASLLREGKDAFLATVQDVAREGFEGALRSADRKRYETWRASDHPGWLFLDSVDEAKLDGIRLRTALRKVADAIDGLEGRAHILLSSRFTDWEARHDLAIFGDALPLPREVPEPRPSITREEALKRVLEREELGGEEREDEKAGTPEQPLVVIMGGLDQEQVAQYAQARGTEHVDAFLDAIDRGNFWGMARRPLDLEWLVARWRRDGAFGSYHDIVEASLAERLQERDPDRRRAAHLSTDKARHGLERIAAGLVFGQRDHLVVPDRERPDDMSADAILDDWSPDEVQWLLSRAVFDPATFGRCRLHNDNRGDVRDYLTACWLRLLAPRLSSRTLRDLLFAEVHGEKVVRPTLRGVAAWLALWDADVARELIQRQPSVLLEAGDAGSLPASVRRSVLEGLAADIRAFGFRRAWFQRDQLARFAQPDLQGAIRSLWERHGTSPDVQLFLLDLIHQGGLRGCADLARSGDFGAVSNHRVLIAAGRALSAAGSEDDRRDLAALVVERASELPAQMVWDAVEDLFPALLGVRELVTIVERSGSVDDILVNGLQHAGAEYVSRIEVAADVETLLVGLIGVAKTDTMTGKEVREDIVPALLAAADRLLAEAPPDVCPELAVDAILVVGRARAFRGSAGDLKPDPRARLEQSWQRRRAAFWRAVDAWNADKPVGTSELEVPYGVQFYGLALPQLREDLDWVLADLSDQPGGAKGGISFGLALHIWRANGEDAGLLDTLRRAATAVGLSENLEASLAPRSLSEEERRLHAQLDEQREVRARQREADRRGWSDFIEGLRHEPGRLLSHEKEAGDVPPDLWNAWNLLRLASQRNTRWEISDLAPLLILIGDEATAAVGDALVAFWRRHRPTTAADRAPGDRNTVFRSDCIGLSGVGVEARRDPEWATKLTSGEASRAAAYATMEMNELPGWLDDLARVWPGEVRDVLHREVASELDHRSPGEHASLADRMSGRDDLSRVMASGVLDLIQDRENLDEIVLTPFIRIVLGGAPDTIDRFVEHAIERVGNEPDISRLAVFAAAALRLDPARAAAHLGARIAGMGVLDQRSLGESLLPLVFGSRFRHTIPVDEIPFSTLVWLVEAGFRTVRLGDDIERPAGEAYSPELRDDAQDARQTALDRLAKTPGKATHDVLIELSERPDFSPIATWLADLARRRAVTDATSAPWPGSAVADFERSGQSLPRTPRELQELALSLFDDIQDDLLHGEFNQGPVVQRLPDERAVQNWVADRLRAVSERRYTVDREPHVAEEKEPDIRLRAVASDASLPIEVKVAESWTLADLRHALSEQLCGRYLRAATGRHGLLLLVHQAPRRHGWEREGEHVSFAEVLAVLREEAAGIAGASPTAPQPLIAVIDVAAFAATRRRQKRSRRPPASGRAEPSR